LWTLLKLPTTVNSSISLTQKETKFNYGNPMIEYEKLGVQMGSKTTK
jgi:hypothetical protein